MSPFAEVSEATTNLIDVKLVVGLVLGALLTLFGKLGEEIVLAPRRRLRETVRAAAIQLRVLRPTVASFASTHNERVEVGADLRRIAAELRADTLALHPALFIATTARRKDLLRAAENLELVSVNLSARMDLQVRREMLDDVIATLEGRAADPQPSNAKPGGAEAGD